MKTDLLVDYVPLLPAMLAGAAEDQGEGSAILAEPQHTPTDPILSTSQPTIPSTNEPLPQPSPPRQLNRQDTKIPQSQGLDSGNIHESPLRSHETPLHEGHTSGSAEDSLQLKGIRYKRKIRSTSIEKDISTDLDADIEVNHGSEDFNTGNEDLNYSSLGVKGKAPMTTEEIQATKRTKAKIQQEEASLAEALRLQALQEEEATRQTAHDESEEEREAFMNDKVTSASSESEIGIDAIPTAIKPPSIVDWKIIPQSGLKAVYQIIRRDGSDKIYMSFRAILKDFSRDDLTELYRLVIKKYGVNRPEEIYDRVLWGDLKTMFDQPFSNDAIWSFPLQQKMINWSCNGIEKDCLSVGLATTQQMVISLPCLTDIKNWLCCTKALATLEQTTTGKEILNPLTADSLLKTIREDEMLLKIKSQNQMIGSLMYLTASRPDIMFAVCACARFQVTPKVSHLHAVKRIFRYLKFQPKLGLWYPRDSPFDLVAFLQ
ncbi:hypothetical protein Tco_0565083 [Tanacetum coccineum]